MASTTSGRSPSTTLTLLTVVVILGGVVAVAYAAARQALIAEHAWLMMIALALLVAPVSTIHIPGVKADVVLGDIVTFSCAVLFGPSAGVLAATADGAITSLRLTRNTTKFLYNVGTCAVSMAGATVTTRAAFGQFAIRGSHQSVGYLAGSIGLFTVSYFLISTGLVAAFVAVSSGKPLLKLWTEKFLWTIVSYLASGVSAVISLTLAARLGYGVFAVVIGLMVVIFIFYKLYFKRFEERVATGNG